MNDLRLKQGKLNEAYYLQTYIDQTIDQFNLKDKMKQQRSFKDCKEGGCNHSRAKFDSKKFCSLHNQDDTNKKLLEQTNSASATLQQSNFQLFRMMFSSKSNIMSIHFLNLNPYQMSIQSYRHLMS